MHCPNCAKSLQVNETTCTRCGRVVLLSDPDTPPWEPWRRWVPLLGLITFAAAAFGIVLAIKPFVANGKSDRIEITLPTLSRRPSTTPDGLPATTVAGAPATEAATLAPGQSAPVGSTTDTTSAVSSSTPDSSATTAATTDSTPSSTASTGATPTTQSLVPAGPLQITGVTASCTAPASTDSRGNPTTFDATNTIDGRESTAWRCPGDASGATLSFTFATPVQITSVGAEPGYNRIDQFNGDDRWLENRRVTSITWSCVTASGATSGTTSQTFQDVRQVQTTATQGDFDKCATLIATITGATPQGTRDYTAISEVSAAGRPATA